MTALEVLFALSVLLLGGSGFIGQAVMRELALQPAGTLRQGGAAQAGI